MVKLIWAPKAIRDLDNILDYISMDSEKYASLVIKGIIDLAETIPDFPVSGRIVFEYGDKNVRETLYKMYRIIYRISNENERIEILRIFHQAQELEIKDLNK